ncbi:MAG: methyltransferase domain-containing protein [Henriciella sp.]|nr:methyltransferase domain-containing protein [Henriciella sp.]
MQTETLSLSKPSIDTRCPACGGDHLTSFYRVDTVPTNSCILFDTPTDAAACLTGDIELCFCEDCGFVYNARFDKSLTEYSGRYEETQGFSPTFSRFHKDLAMRLIEEHNLDGKKVTEIGCGKGEFLLLLSDLAGVSGIGIDPSAIQERIKGVPGAERVTLIPEYYQEHHGEADADAIVCKMTLEHIPNAEEFLTTVRRSLDGRPNTLVFFQIPEAERILEQCAFEDIYYEHCAYFTPGSLGRLFRRCGFDVVSLGKEYDDQYLTIEARPSQAEPSAPLAIEDDLEKCRALVQSFGDRNQEMKDKWQEVVKTAKTNGQTVALWGSGSKAVSFLTTLGLGDDIDAVVDINPNRHNHYMPITCQKIIGPDDLVAVDPALVIVMNRIYVPEITEDLNKRGMHPKVMAL